MSTKDTEVTELVHEPWPGFIQWFWVAFSSSLVYLLIIIVSSIKGHGHG